VVWLSEGQVMEWDGQVGLGQGVLNDLIPSSRDATISHLRSSPCCCGRGAASGRPRPV